MEHHDLHVHTTMKTIVLPDLPVIDLKITQRSLVLMYFSKVHVHADEADRIQKKIIIMIDKLWIVDKTMPLKFLSRPVSEH